MQLNDALTRININLEHMTNLLNMILDVQSRSRNRYSRPGFDQRREPVPIPNINSIMTTILADIAPVPRTIITHNTIMNNTTIDIIAEADAIEQCSICRDTYSEQTITRKINMCGHYFHCGCLDTWLLNNDTCPNCRTNIVAPASAPASAPAPAPASALTPASASAPASTPASNP